MFIQPYAQPALHDELGLTTDDLAKVLETTKRSIETVLNKSGFMTHAKNNGLQITQVVAETRNHGRKSRITVMDLECARIFAARYGSQAGFNYAVWLVRIEMKVIPQLYKKITELEGRLQKRLPGAKQGLIQAPIYHEDMFGDLSLSHFVTVNKEMLSRVELIEAQQVHISKVIEGLSKTNRQLTLEQGKERRKPK